MHTVSHRPIALVGLVMTQGLLLILFVMATSFDTNHDAALYLQCGQLILDGKTPYVDFYDNNPPLIMVLSCLPVLLAKLTHLSVMASFAMFVLGLIGLSTMLICKLWRAKNESPDRLCLLLSAWFLFHLLTAIGRDFGQREHLFATCSAPYLLLRITRYQPGLGLLGRPWLFVTGFYAAVGIFLKPHFILIVVLFELVLFSGLPKFKMLLKPEVAGLAGFGLLYALLFLLSPSVRTNYLQLIAPLVARGNWVYYVSIDKLLANFHPLRNPRNPYFLLSLLLALATGLLGTRYLRADRQKYRSCLALFVAAMAALASYLYQAKGWPYHLIPFCFFSGLASVYCILEITACKPQINLNATLKCAILILVLTCSTALEYHFYTIRESHVSAILHDIENESLVNDRVIVFFTSLGAYPSMIQAQTQPGSRFLWFFPFAMLYANAHDPALTEAEILNMGPVDRTLEARFLRELADDIVQHKPGLILINPASGDQGLPYRLHFKNYLAHHKILDLIQSRYQRVPNQVSPKGTTSEFEIWRLRPELQ